jgi:hypothetical protein
MTTPRFALTYLAQPGRGAVVGKGTELAGVAAGGCVRHGPQRGTADAVGETGGMTAGRAEANCHPEKRRLTRLRSSAR